MSLNNSTSREVISSISSFVKKFNVIHPIKQLSISTIEDLATFLQAVFYTKNKSKEAIELLFARQLAFYDSVLAYLLQFATRYLLLAFYYSLIIFFTSSSISSALGLLK